MNHFLKILSVKISFNSIELVLVNPIIIKVIAENDPSYSLNQYQFFQKCISLYILFHFSSLLINIYSLLSVFEIFLLLTTLISAGFIFFDIKSHIVSLICWLVVVIFSFGNLALYGLNHDYIGWLLLAMAAIKTGEHSYQFPKIIKTAAWLILGLGYMASGLNKLFLTDFWVNGTALGLLYAKSPVFFKYDFLNTEVGANTLQFLTWFVLILEVSFLFCLMNKYLKFLVYILMTLTHLFIATTTQMTEVSLSALVFHVFIFESTWLHKSFWIKNESLHV